MLRSLNRRWHSPQNTTFPANLVVVRNGISEGIVALRKYTEDHDPVAANRLIDLHGSKWRLTDTGRDQAKSAGQWLIDQYPDGFNVHLSGEYVRSLETAASLGLPEVRWVKSLYLRRRDYGSYSVLAALPQPLAEAKRDRYYWTPPNGESIAQLALRTERVLYWIRHHIPPDGSALIVTHKDVMESIRIAIEKISPLDYEEMIEHPTDDFRLEHGSVLQYTRRNPNTGEMVPTYRWVSVVTPWNRKNLEKVNWHGLYTRHNGSQELLAEVSNVPHLFETK
jgi:broad specificity phosphatase PhoE